MKKQNINPIDWDTLESHIQRAINKTDLLAPEDINDIANILLSDQPISKVVRTFLGVALQEIANGKETKRTKENPFGRKKIPPLIALRMVSGGKPKEWQIYDKWMACDLAKREMDKGISQKKACEEIAHLINQRFTHIKSSEQKESATHDHPAWSAFFGKTVTSEMIKKWLIDFSPSTMGARFEEKG
jgi:hypothetical protein